MGRYKYGIIIGDYIFKYEDILGKYKENNNLIIVLKNNDKIIIKDKKAEKYLKKMVRLIKKVLKILKYIQYLFNIKLFFKFNMSNRT